jgi:hypothetical protein
MDATSPPLGHLSAFARADPIDEERQEVIEPA